MKKLKKAIAILSAICMCVPAVCAIVACAPVENNSAYETWLKSGHTGTQEDFENWIKNGGDASQGEGPSQGDSDDDKAYEIWLEQGNTGSKDAFLQWLSADHTPKDTAYELWLSNGYAGTKEDFFEWLKTDGGRNAIRTDSASLEYAFHGLYGFGELNDVKRGIWSASTLTGARFSVNGKYTETYTSHATNSDVKFELYGEKNTRIADTTNGIAYTLPTTSLEADYSLSKYRVQYKFDDCLLTTSVESGNPYETWYTYGNEWLFLYINDNDYIKNNNLERINGTKAYQFTEKHDWGDKTTKDGFDYYRFDIHIKDDEGVEYPYYQIAIFRPNPDSNIKDFTMFVLKSRENQKEVMDVIVDSYRLIAPQGGTAQNYYNAGKPRENPRWDDNTKAYFNQLMNGNYVHWGAFSYSMLATEDMLDPNLAAFKERVDLLNAYQAGVEEIWGYKYDICPTYGHLGFYNSVSYFPLEMAKQVAGGDGVNGKPVLQFSYQYTVNNNNVKAKTTPLFDIMRGKYDENFRRLAADLKAYKNPVLFRLNNEMNSDWTSYCGLLNMLDPDIYTMTWRRLYDIFEEENVTNVIWIWNPNDKSSPYCGWGEDMCYFPGRNYVQLLGGTIYEMNNGDGSVANSFREGYSALYEKNKAAFREWGMTISEFACGSGGEVAYSYDQSKYLPAVSGRNSASQATYITNMFNELTAENKPEWVKLIKGAIWFNVNDDALVDGVYKTNNRLRFYEPNSTAYDDLADTWAAFKAGFAKQKQMMQKS